ncbi:MAG: hypothetical protein ACTSQP_10130 [Promethearchaeota archaeon]
MMYYLLEMSDFYWIFYLNWILIDTIIIFLLILLLLGVKIYKKTHRWRKSFSNENLEKIKIKLKNSVKDVFLIKSKFREYLLIKPIVFLISNKKKRLTYIISEGLASYGFLVFLINMRRKIKEDTNYSEQWNTIFNDLIELLKTKELIKNLSELKASIIFSCCSNIKIEKLRNVLPSVNFILINPTRLNFNVINNLSIENNKNKIIAIFSEKNYFFIKNPHINNILSDRLIEKLYDIEIIIIKNAKKSFKFYETILLGYLIKFLK